MIIIFRLIEYILQTDDSSNVLYRTMHIHATDEQLLKLKNLNDPDEIDSLIAEILKQTNFGTAQLVKEATIDAASTLYNAIPSFDISFEIPSRTIEISINFALIVGGYIVCRKYGINFMIVITFSALYFLYLYLDYECRKVIIKLNIYILNIMLILFIHYFEIIYLTRKLLSKIQLHLFMEVKRIHVRILERTVGGNIYLEWTAKLNAVNIYRKPKQKFHSIIIKKSYYYNTCFLFLNRKKSTNPKNQCGVVDLFNEFTSNIIFKQMKIFSMSIADMVQTINGESELRYSNKYNN